MPRDGLAGQDQKLASFRDAARCAGAVSHGSITRVYDYDEPGPPQRPYLVMEFVDGPSLAQLLASGPADPALVMDVVAQVADALQAAHQAGLSHHDIRPETIMLSPDGPVKLSGLGLAAAGSPAGDGDWPDAAPGAPGGEAPQATPGSRSSDRANHDDLRALGLVAYQCLTGELPGTTATVARALSNSLRAVRPDLARDLAAFVSQLIAATPQCGPGSASEVAGRALALHRQLAPMPECQDGTRRVAPATPLPRPARPGRKPLARAGNSLPRHGRKVLIAVATVTTLTMLTWMAIGPTAPRPTDASPVRRTVHVDGRQLTGQPVEAVRSQLRQLGLLVRIQWRLTSRLRPGLVMAVKPVGLVPAGSTVMIIGSLAREPAARTAPRTDRAASRPGQHRHPGNPSPAGQRPPSQAPSPPPAPRPGPAPTPSPDPSPSPSPSPAPTPVQSPDPSPSPGPSSPA